MVSHQQCIITESTSSWCTKSGKAGGMQSQHSLVLWVISWVTSHVQGLSFPLWAPLSFEAGRIVSRNGDIPFPALSKQLHNPLSEPSPKPRLQFFTPVFPPEISLSSFPLPLHIYSTQECWVFKEIRRYSSLKTKTTLEIPDFGVRALWLRRNLRPGWHPSCLLNVAFRQNLRLW